MNTQRAIDVSQELRLRAPHAGSLQALLNRAARLIEDGLPKAEQKAIRGRFGGKRKPSCALRPVAQPLCTHQEALL